MAPNRQPGKSAKPDPDGPCQCGSRKKFRNCCKPKQDRGRVVMFIVLVIGGVLAAKFLFAPERAAPPAPAGKIWSEEHGHYHDAPGVGAPVGSAPASPLAPANDGGQTGAQTAAPPGQAPTGKVWSAEHGHYHDAPAPISGSAPGSPNPANSSGTPNGPAAGIQPTPQPPGPVPPGKVWSAEHGHWHDAQKP